MCISGIGPSSVILHQAKYGKRQTYDAKIMPKQVETKRDGVVTEVDGRTWLNVPSCTYDPPAVTLSK